MAKFRMIPQPVSGRMEEGDLVIAPCYKCGDGAFLKAGELLCDAADRLCRKALTPGENGVHFLRKAGLEAGAYEIRIGNRCEVFASGGEGALYAAATLTQLLRRAPGGLSLPKGTIADKPQSAWRGLMVDLARKWHPMHFLYQYVDLCWFYKINRLHLHFCDDQSYTLPSSAFPMLPTHGRHYSFAEIAALREYAGRRGIIIVPEIETPGHSAQFCAKYPDVFGAGGIHCCEEKTFAGLRKLFQEVCEMFPDSPYIHIGGEEADIAKWNDCTGCARYRVEKNLPNVQAMYAHFVNTVAEIVLELGRKPVAWEGFSKEYNHMVTRDLLMIAWENYYQTAPELADAGFTLINASWKPTYVVTPNMMWSREEILEWNPRKWTHWWEKSKAYNTTLTVPESAAVLGGQMCAWGDGLIAAESNYDASTQEMVRVRERLPALAERTWRLGGTPADSDTWEKLDDMAARLMI